MKKKYLIRIDKNLHDYALEIAPILVGLKDFSRVVEFLIQKEIDKRNMKEKRVFVPDDLNEFMFT